MMINLAIKVFVFTIFFLALPRSWFDYEGLHTFSLNVLLLIYIFGDIVDQLSTLKHPST